MTDETSYRIYLLDRPLLICQSFLNMAEGKNIADFLKKKTLPLLYKERPLLREGSQLIVTDSNNYVVAEYGDIYVTGIGSEPFAIQPVTTINDLISSYGRSCIGSHANFYDGDKIQFFQTIDKEKAFTSRLELGTCVIAITIRLCDNAVRQCHKKYQIAKLMDVKTVEKDVFDDIMLKLRQDTDNYHQKTVEVNDIAEQEIEKVRERARIQIAAIPKPTPLESRVAKLLGII